MRCGECKRELEVGDRYIKFTQTEWAERNGLKPLKGFDDLFAQMMGSEAGDDMVFCEDCTVEVDDGFLLDTVYGDEYESDTVADERKTDD